MRRRSFATKLIVGCVLLTVIALLLSGTLARLRSHYTCAVCRLYRQDNDWRPFGTHSTYQENTCSEWYPLHVEADHEHVWAKGASVGMVDYFGQTIGVGDNLDRPGRMIWRLTPEEQAEIYKHFDNPLEAKRLFVALLDPALVADRQDAIVLIALQEWIESGFKGDFQNPLAEE